MMFFRANAVAFSGTMFFMLVSVAFVRVLGPNPPHHVHAAALFALGFGLGWSCRDNAHAAAVILYTLGIGTVVAFWGGLWSTYWMNHIFAALLGAIEIGAFVVKRGSSTTNEELKPLPPSDNPYAPTARPK